VSESFDLAIIGGGVNGCGIARDAAGRGLSVFLCDMGDLGGGTSSRSTKLIHGGLRYLEQFDFRLVREALAEREVIWAIAPHIVRPLRFVLPHQAGLRPAWVLRAGLFLYDHLGGRRRLPPTRSLDLAADAAGRPLKPGVFARGFEYSDCWVDDARLVVLNARDAAERGAIIRARTRAIEASRTREGWRVTVAEAGSGKREEIAARALINAAGPWVEAVASVARDHKLQGKVRLVQGSHIVVRKLFGHDRAYILQRPDGRIVFAIPYEGDFTLIGTTDRDYGGDPVQVSATAAEITYLCEAASAAFAQTLRAGDVVWSYGGVRPLYDDGVSEAKAASRDYVLELDAPEGGAPLLSIIGGKITTYRRLAEAALAQLARHLPARQGLPAGWTGRTSLPGGDFAPEALPEIAAGLARSYPFLERAHVLRLVGAYGTRAERMLGKARSALDLGRQFGATLTEAEVRYLIDQEWAVTAEDVLWRRSKLGLRLSGEEVAQLSAFMGESARPAAVGGG
jgi:glycerol-3-phosphate dehydrogenase